MRADGRAMRYFPIFLDLQDRRCVVVGGGAVAARKVDMLTRGGRLADLRSAGRIEHLGAAFRADHLDGAGLVVAATNDAGSRAD